MEAIEIWREIDFTDGKYSVSNLGRVKRNEIFFIDSLGRKCSLDSHVLKNKTKKDGYESIGLRMDFYKKSYSVHRLVAIAFVENENEYPCVDHIDGNRANNVSSNLRWCTHKQNTNFNLARIHYKECSDRKRKAVVKMDGFGNIVSEYDSCIDAAIAHGTCQSEISRACMGIRKNKFGFNWAFKELC